MTIQSDPRRAHVDKTDVPIVDPREARKGRYVTGRKSWCEFCKVVRGLEAEMAVRGISGWSLVATFSVASHVWQCYAVDASKAAE